MASSYRVFAPSVEGSTEGAFRGCRRPRGVPPRLIPTHEVGKPYKHEHGRKYWHYFLRMDNHPKGWLHLYEPSLGMICSYGKVMTNIHRHTRDHQMFFMRIFLEFWVNIGNLAEQSSAYCHYSRFFGRHNQYPSLVMYTGEIFNTSLSTVAPKNVE